VTSDSSLALPVSMLIVYAGAKLMAEVFERMKQPAILGEILAGAILGPSVLALVAPDARLDMLAELGVLFLLFNVGLEVNAAELWAVRGTATIVATAGVILPLAAGWLLMSMLGSTTPEAIFVGAALVATSVGITAQALAARGLLNQKASRIILAAAVIDDVLGLIVLAVVSGFAKGGLRLIDVGITAALAITFTIVLAKWGAPAMRRAAPAVQARLRAGETQFTIAMITLLSLSALATYTGVAAIVGAFLAGLAMSETATERVRVLSHGVNELMVPFFLAGIGLHLQLAALRDWDGLILVSALFVVAVVTKVAGCGLGALGMGTRNMLKIGLGMVPRGEVGMVVAQLGLSAGVLTQRAYGAVVVMAVLTTVITPVFIRFVFETEPASPAPAELGEEAPCG
jgi:Kef-type K+ transport system membrane component KefB